MAKFLCGVLKMVRMGVTVMASLTNTKYYLFILAFLISINIPCALEFFCSAALLSQ